MNSLAELCAEAQEALEKVWFAQMVEETERADDAVSLRLIIDSATFVHVFFSEHTGSLYLALIQSERRIFGIDRVEDEWHLHPYESVGEHLPLSESLEPKPLLRFLARVEEVLVDHSLL